MEKQEEDISVGTKVLTKHDLTKKRIGDWPHIQILNLRCVFSSALPYSVIYIDVQTAGVCHTQSLGLCCLQYIGLGALQCLHPSVTWWSR